MPISRIRIPIAVLLLMLVPSMVSAGIVWNYQYGTTDLNTIDVNATSIATGNTAGTVYLLNLDGVEQWNLDVFPDEVKWVKITQNGVVAANASKNSTVVLIRSGVLQWRYDNKTDAGPFVGIDANTTGAVILATTRNRSYVLDGLGATVGFPKPTLVTGGYSAFTFPQRCKVIPNGSAIIFCPIDQTTGAVWSAAFARWEPAGGLYADGYTSAMDPIGTWILPGTSTFAQGLSLDPTSEFIIGTTDHYVGIARIDGWVSTGYYTEPVAASGTTDVSSSTSASSSMLGRGVVLEIINPTGSLIGYDSVGGTLYAADMDTTGYYACSGGLDGRMRIYTKNTSTTWGNIYTDGTREVIYGVRMSSGGDYAYAARAGGWVTKYSVPTSAVVTPVQIQYYTQRQVRIRAVDKYGNPLVGANITASYISSSLPSTDISWLISAFGVDSTVAEQMTNSSIGMIGFSGNDGAVNFMMFPVIKYLVNITNATAGLNHQTSFYPEDTDYTIYTILSSQATGNGTVAKLGNTSLWVTFPDAYHVTFCMGYQDLSTLTQNVSFNVWKYGNESTKDAGLPLLMYSYVFNQTGTRYVQDCNYTAVNIRADSYRFLWNASRTALY